jgi:hypothetical protein
MNTDETGIWKFKAAFLIRENRCPSVAAKPLYFMNIPLFLISLELWKVAGWVTVGSAFCALGLFIWIWIESEVHARRLRKMQRQTDEKRDADCNSGFFGDNKKDAPPYSPKRRARYLP